jgi:valyl-tRNA synthetase
VLVTGFDIIFFWVARMIMMGLKFTGKIPFHEIYITGLIRDENGQKMSKSKGNVLDPIDVIDGIDLETLVAKRTSGMMQPRLAEKVEKYTRKQFPEGIKSYGTDALRFTFCALASNNRDINFDLNRVEGYRNFCNKIWNAARFVLMNNEQQIVCEQKSYSLADKWIQSLLQQTIASYEKHIANYRFDLASQALYEFVWNEYCDWYLELTKGVMYSEQATDAEKAGTQETLINVLDAMLRLLHPFMPFITEEIWQKVSTITTREVKEGSLIIQQFPDFDESQVDQLAEQDVAWLKQVIVAIRNIRGEMNIAPSKRLQVMFDKGTEQDQRRVQEHQQLLMNLAKLESVQWLSGEAPLAVTALAGDMEVLIPMKGLIDKDAELSRLAKEISKLEQDLKRVQGKLSNPGFTAKAPEAVVAKEQQKLDEMSKSLRTLTSKQQQIKDL